MPMIPRGAPPLVVLSLALPLAAAACGGSARQAPPEAAVAPQLTVERFLHACNTHDLDTMARLFGTADGPVGDTGSTFGCAFKKIGSWFGGSSCVDRSEVEVRLDAIARILRHDDYEIGREEQVPGRTRPTRRVFVDLTRQEQRIVSVPFDVVRAGDGAWLVERVDLERVMAGGR